MAEAAAASAREKLFRHSAYTRAHPHFERERHRALEVASLGRAVLEDAGAARPLGDALDAFFRSLLSPYPPIMALPANLKGWTQGWAASDSGSLRAALECFSDTAASPEARFDRFVAAGQAAQAAGALARGPNKLLPLGSLFNFAVAPESLPIVAPLRFAALARICGREIRGDVQPGAAYRHLVAFARALEADMSAFGIPVRDLLDVQCLIWLEPDADDELWRMYPPPSVEPAIRPSDRHDGKPYLSICACLGYEAPYLAEWIEFHRLVGVERFFLYNNADRDAQRDVLAPFVDEGLVVLHEWDVFPPQIPAHEHCLEEHREDARWIAFIDVDEFLFSPDGTPLPAVLADYERWPAVGVNQVRLGPSGHRVKPDGLVIESYVRPIPSPRWVKSVVDPSRTLRAGIHQCVYSDGLAVDESRYPFVGMTTAVHSCQVLRLNHYWTRSEAEFETKLRRPMVSAGEYYPEGMLEGIRQQQAFFDHTDDAILQYVPRLRDALAGKRAPAGS